MHPISISPTIESLGAIAFWYVIHFFFFNLLWLDYNVQQSFQCVVTLTRPIHCFLVLFTCMTNIQPSFTHSISSKYVWRFTQFAATSLKLLQYRKWYNLTNKNETWIAFYYEGTSNYFGYPHAFLGILAIIILKRYVVCSNQKTVEEK